MEFSIFTPSISNVSTSYKIDNDISSLIHFIKEKQKKENDTGTWNNPFFLSWIPLGG